MCLASGPSQYRAECFSFESNLALYQSGLVFFLLLEPTTVWGLEDLEITS